MEIKKNIILIDLNYSMVHSLYSSKNIHIDTIIVSSEIQKQDLYKKYKIENVYSMETIQDFYKECNINIDYELIAKYKSTQVKVENWFNRITSDINMVQYLYYNALSHWNDVLKSNKIDAVIYEGHEYGSNFDSIIFDLAVSYNVNVYLIELVLENGSDLYAFSIFDYVSKKYVPIDKELLRLKDIVINDYLYYKIKLSTKENKSFKDFLVQYPESVGGYLFITFVAQCLGKYKGLLHSFKINWSTYFKNYIYSKKLIQHYNKVSVEFDKSKKYIFYALHMEPEASTLARTTYSNQLVIIKSLAQKLPKDWILYVKEHPHQLTKLNNFTRYYFLASLEKFRTKSFYNEITKLPNVKLLNITTNSKDILKHAKAISTINGTIALESIVLRKPLLLFSQNTTPFQNLDDVFNIKNSNDIENALNKIESNFMSKYDDLDCLIENYFFEAEFGKNNNYKKLVQYLVIGNENG